MVARSKRANRKNAHAPPTERRRGRVRASWKGMLRVDLVQFSVQAINMVAPEQSDLHLNQLHEPCNSRIHYQKVCPLHGEVPNEEIVSAFEYARNKYVKVTDEELDRLRTDADKALAIDTFVGPEEIDPVLFDGRNYFLVPAGPHDREPYDVLCRAMDAMGRYGVGQVVFSGREQLVLVRPHEGLLTMSMLRHAAEMRPASQLAIETPPADPRTVKLAETLIEAATEPRFDFAAYEDLYRKRLQQLIDTKIEGKEVAMPPVEEEPQVINLMEALKRSIAKAQTTEDDRQTAAPRRERKRHAS